MRNNKYFRLAVMLFGCIWIFFIILQDTGLDSKISERLTVWYDPAQDAPKLGYETCVDGVTLEAFQISYPELVKELKTNYATQSKCVHDIMWRLEPPTTEVIQVPSDSASSNLDIPNNSQPHCRGNRIGLILCLAMYLSGNPAPENSATKTMKDLSLPRLYRLRTNEDDYRQLRATVALEYYRKLLIDNAPWRSGKKEQALKFGEISIATRAKQFHFVFCVGDLLNRNSALTPLCYLPGVARTPYFTK
jgi:hypothetical protein